ncbi:hypothetical protein HN011_010560 [Eciton burchellii]|nr:hypothetical protein HN011_010560 [Eciton burchellii]
MVNSYIDYRAWKTHITPSNANVSWKFSFPSFGFCLPSVPPKSRVERSNGEPNLIVGVTQKHHWRWSIIAAVVKHASETVDSSRKDPSTKIV